MLDTWLPLPISLVALILTHLLVTRTLITLAFRLFHSLPMALVSYAVLIWPGTVVHEWAHWLAARLMGLSDAEADAYAKDVIRADFEEAGDEDVIRKLLGDLTSAGVDIDEPRIRAALERMASEAKRQLAETS